MLNVSEKRFGIKPRQKSFISKPRIVFDDLKLPLTVRRATCLILKKDENRDSADEFIIEQLRCQNSKLALAIELSQAFIKLVRERTPEKFDEWLTQIQLSQITPLVNFAQGLIHDYDAVKSPNDSALE
jgi:transposase